MSAPGQASDFRLGIRACVDASAQLRTDDGLVSTVAVRNTSLSGAFLETQAKLSPLARVALRPLVNEGEWLDATVVRVESTGVAIAWHEPGLHALYVLLSSRPTM